MNTDLTTERIDWQTYRADGNEAARERLIERHVPLVRYFARRLATSLGAGPDMEELASAGMLGLLDAVEAYEPERGYRFSTFAAPRIRGAMLDELRRRDDAPRSVRRRQRQLAETEERLAVRLNRAPRHGEVAAVLGVDTSTLWSWKSDAERATRISLDEHPGDRTGGAGNRFSDVLVLEGPDPEDRLAREQEVDRLHRELDGLDERERLVLRLYDLQDMKLREIAALLKVTESRVSQIRTRALGRLRDRMGDLREKVAA